ncbi:MAG: RICIN domain-containing protein [Candidatus Acidiferrum sp.]
MTLCLSWTSGCGGGSGGGGGTTVPPPSVAPPTIAKSFGAATVAMGGTTTLTFMLSNPNAGTSLTGVGFTDPLPAGLVISTPNGLSGTCGGGTITAVAGSASVNLASATLAGTASCNFVLNVTATATGTQNNSTGAVTSNEGGAGKNTSASITVSAASQQPAEPTDTVPLNGETYYLLNQLSGLQADLNNNSATAGDNILQSARSFSSLSQRWAFTKLSTGGWRISNLGNHLCLDSVVNAAVTYVVQSSTFRKRRLPPAQRSTKPL